mmetsp:Transcript_28063/g.59849  ORF Transcript_28063/g.59849 Transcript_28063/m.59849 type:complete len:144 (-) Transcript_28063:364-795(-)
MKIVVGNSPSLVLLARLLKIMRREETEREAEGMVMSGVVFGISGIRLYCTMSSSCPILFFFLFAISYRSTLIVVNSVIIQQSSSTSPQTPPHPYTRTAALLLQTKTTTHFHCTDFEDGGGGRWAISQHIIMQMSNTIMASAAR